MNRSDLIATMTERLGGDRSTAVTAVNGVLEEIQRSVARGERVSLTGFGTFERRERAARTARNPRTGEAVRVAPSVVPVFRAGTAFRTSLSAAAPVPDAQEPAPVESSSSRPGGRTGKPAKAEDGKGKGRKKDKKSGKDGGKKAPKAGKKAR